MSNKELFVKAHKMAKEIKKEYPEVDYMLQFSLCLTYLREEEGNKEITWKDVEEATEKAVERLGYTDYYLNNWAKGEHDRTYIEIRWYRNGKCKSVKKCGYWDNINNIYVIDNKYNKNYNVFEM
ncbi:MAG: hypothetical protein E6344_19785 [Clostridium sp.]|uniref:hypothetical protein n=1 Tax=Clostridium tertium TaxID=1559 RepID=UPI00290E2E3B|nr:hypothetical protein [Clostridium sp.]